MIAISNTGMVVILLACLLLHDAAAEWVETAKLLDSDGETGNLFGWDVAMDNGILAVGALLDNIGRVARPGSVTTFELSDGQWVAQQKLTASDAGVFHGFGWAVAISNGALVVGAPLEGDDGFSPGAVYIYGKGAEGVWTEQQKLTASDAAGGDTFGYSLAMQNNALTVGTRRDDSESGSVYIYSLSAFFWTQAAKLTARDPSAGDRFGHSVVIDLNTIAVGAPLDDDLGVNSGSVYVFQRDSQGVSWTQVAKLTPSDGQSLDDFGRTVAIRGGTIFVGSLNNADGENVGAVYQFGEEGGTWTQQNKLVTRDVATNARFGFGLAVRDGTLVVGADRQDRGTREVYVFQQDSGVWVEQGQLVASDGAADDRFGTAVTVNDGLAIVGAYGDNSNRGSVYVFDWRESVTDGRPSAVPIPAMQPSQYPSVQPSAEASITPSVGASKFPISQPTRRPSEQPAAPIEQPAAPLSTPPSVHPSAKSSITPSVKTSKVPTTQPSWRPSEEPAAPTVEPTAPSEQSAAPISTAPAGGLQLNMVVLVVGIAFVLVVGIALVASGMFAVLIYSRRNNSDHQVVFTDDISELEEPSVGNEIQSSNVHTLDAETPTIDHSEETSAL